MSTLSQLLNQRTFVITADIDQPREAYMNDILNTVNGLKDNVDAVTLKSTGGPIITPNPLGFATRIMDIGTEITLQVQCANHNRLAIQADLLAASMLGIENILCITGEPADNIKNHPIKSVFDVDSTELLRITSSLTNGIDSLGNIIPDAPTFFLGSTVNPYASELADEVIRMEEKVEAGAKFFQTPPIFDRESLEQLIDIVKSLNTPVIASILILQSGDMARRVDQMIGGAPVPYNVTDQMDNATDKIKTGIEIAAGIIGNIKDLCAGIHIISPGQNENILRLINKLDHLDLKNTLATER